MTRTRTDTRMIRRAMVLTMVATLIMVGIWRIWNLDIKVLLEELWGSVLLVLAMIIVAMPTTLLWIKIRRWRGRRRR